MCFWGTTDQRAQTNFLPRGPKVLSAPLTVVPVHKGGTRHCVSYYQPISILSPINKLFETLLRKRLTEFFDKYSLCVSRFGKSIHTVNHETLLSKLSR